MQQSYFLEQYQFWTKVNSITFERKLENETAFDGVVKIYSLKTNVASLSDKLKGHFFGEFNFPTENGIFLRMFANKDSWPKTTLIHIDLINSMITEINTNNSSWLVWTGKHLADEKYSIEISPSESLEYEIGNPDKPKIVLSKNTVREKPWWKFW
jgi:hypothetical protein